MTQLIAQSVAKEAGPLNYYPSFKNNYSEVLNVLSVTKISHE